MENKKSDNETVRNRTQREKKRTIRNMKVTFNATHVT